MENFVLVETKRRREGSVDDAPEYSDDDLEYFFAGTPPCSICLLRQKGKELGLAVAVYGINTLEFIRWNMFYESMIIKVFENSTPGTVSQYRLGRLVTGNNARDVTTREAALKDAATNKIAAREILLKEKEIAMGGALAMRGITMRVSADIRDAMVRMAGSDR